MRSLRGRLAASAALLAMALQTASAARQLRGDGATGAAATVETDHDMVELRAGCAHAISDLLERAAKHGDPVDQHTMSPAVSAACTIDFEPGTSRLHSAESPKQGHLGFLDLVAKLITERISLPFAGANGQLRCPVSIPQPPSAPFRDAGDEDAFPEDAPVRRVEVVVKSRVMTPQERGVKEEARVRVDVLDRSTLREAAAAATGGHEATGGVGDIEERVGTAVERAEEAKDRRDAAAAEAVRRTRAAEETAARAEESSRAAHEAEEETSKAAERARVQEEQAKADAKRAQESGTTEAEEIARRSAKAVEKAEKAVEEAEHKASVSEHEAAVRKDEASEVAHAAEVAREEAKDAGVDAQQAEEQEKEIEAVIEKMEQAAGLDRTIDYSPPAVAPITGAANSGTTVDIGKTAEEVHAEASARADQHLERDAAAAREAARRAAEKETVDEIRDAVADEIRTVEGDGATFAPAATAAATGATASAGTGSVSESIVREFAPQREQAGEEAEAEAGPTAATAATGPAAAAAAPAATAAPAGEKQAGERPGAEQRAAAATAPAAPAAPAAATAAAAPAATAAAAPAAATGPGREETAEDAQRKAVDHIGDILSAPVEATGATGGSAATGLTEAAADTERVAADLVREAEAAVKEAEGSGLWSKPKEAEAKEEKAEEEKAEEEKAEEEQREQERERDLAEFTQGDKFVVDRRKEPEFSGQGPFAMTGVEIVPLGDGEEEAGEAAGPRPSVPPAPEEATGTTGSAFDDVAGMTGAAAAEAAAETAQAEEEAQVSASATGSVSQTTAVPAVDAKAEVDVPMRATVGPCWTQCHEEQTKSPGSTFHGCMWKCMRPVAERFSEPTRVCLATCEYKPSLAEYAPCVRSCIDKRRPSEVDEDAHRLMKAQ